jgi:hypothetical protein
MEELQPAVAAKLKSLRDCFQHGAESHAGLCAVLVECPMYQNYKSEVFRFSIPGVDCHLSFFAFTPELRSANTARHLGVVDEKWRHRLDAAVDDSHSLWNMFRVQAIQGGPLVCGAGNLSRADPSPWVLAVINWAASLPSTDFRRVLRDKRTAAEWRRSKGSFTFLSGLPDLSEGLTLTNVDDLCAASHSDSTWRYRLLASGEP